MKIIPNNLKRMYDLYAPEYEQKALEVLRSGWYILGREVEHFEKEFASYMGAKHCVGLANGLDALWMSVHLLDIGPGDEVIVCSNAYIACVMGITKAGATPVFVEPDEYDNLEPFHIQHALTVEGVMRYFARQLGYGAEEDFWGLVGLLHDVDFERYPEQHCVKAPELLREIGAEDAFIHAVVSHGYGLCVDVKPELEMEKVLFATDELTGLIGAAARMRPSHSVADMELSSLKKKFKDKKFAAGCSRDVIRQGAERLGWELDKLLGDTIEAMRPDEAAIAEAVAKLG